MQTNYECYCMREWSITVVVIIVMIKIMMLDYRAETYVAMTTLILLFIHPRYTVFFWFIIWPLLCLFYYQIVCKFVKERLRADRYRRRQNIVYAWQINYYDDDYYNFIHCQQQREQQQQQREEEEQQLVLQMSNLSLRAFEQMEVDDCSYNNW
ncbi:hypothetical protein BDA99DRAFT_571650 [Phascolomyces articulosus]|uniref:Uncharacterized protein n=1 Tax=Phascolomyces articulosus TaxID=60185 RepID=A0AAD5KAN0_9FUNG|nr:hypothetical protein BDA99DRAFT_571650 [Phascolomyces articulosus]